jgi:tetratricopeptide (TPR) repeat protein
MEAGDFAGAASKLEESIAAIPASTPGVPLLQFALGTAWLRAGEPGKAVGPLEKAVVADPAAQAPLADAYRGAARAQDARRLYEKAASGDSLNARYAKARIAELDAAIESDAAKAVALLFSAAEIFSTLGADDSVYFDEATKLLEEIARGKKWRGEPTARAVFSLGEVQREKKAYPEAIAHYQRCFVSWSRYPQWSAKAYLRAAAAFEALGRRAEAIAHLHELVRKADKYGKLPEFNEAKKQLRAWGEVVQ